MNDIPLITTRLESWQIPILKLNRAADAPSVFISYSQTQDQTGEHRSWVMDLGMKLALLGINVESDNNVDGHESFGQFMQKVCNEKFVICVCSDSYVKKANDPNNRTGVIWEIEKMSSRGRYKQSPASFIIPIIKDGSLESFPHNLPNLIAEHDIPAHNFETQQEAMGSFAKIVDRLLGVKNLISENFKDDNLYQKYAMDIFTNFYNATAQYWCAKRGSNEENQLRELITSKHLFELSLEEKNKNDISGTFCDNFSEKELNLIGRWDSSSPGDQEILKLLTGDSDNE